MGLNPRGFLFLFFFYQKRTFIYFLEDEINTTRKLWVRTIFYIRRTFNFGRKFIMAPASKTPSTFFFSSENSSYLLGLTQYLRSPPKISWASARTSLALKFFLLFYYSKLVKKKRKRKESKSMKVLMWKKTKQKILGVRTHDLRCEKIYNRALEPRYRHRNFKSMIVLDVKFDITRGLEEVMISDHRNFFFFSMCGFKEQTASIERACYRSLFIGCGCLLYWNRTKALALPCPFNTCANLLWIIALNVLKSVNVKWPLKAGKLGSINTYHHRSRSLFRIILFTIRKDHARLSLSISTRITQKDQMPQI